MTAVLPEKIEHLDFAVRCDVDTCNDNPDAAPAAEIVALSFRSCECADKFPICAPHASQMRRVERAIFVCVRHGIRHQFDDLIIRFEPLQ